MVKVLIAVVALLLLVRLFLSRNPSALSPAKAWEMVDGGALLVDVRTPGEFAGGHLDGALNIPHTEIEGRAGELGSDTSRPIVLYCRSGARAVAARGLLLRKGFATVVNAGGYDQLAAARRQ